MFRNFELLLESWKLKIDKFSEIAQKMGVTLWLADAVSSKMRWLMALRYAAFRVLWALSNWKPEIFQNNNHLTKSVEPLLCTKRDIHIHTQGERFFFRIARQSSQNKIKRNLAKLVKRVIAVTRNVLGSNTKKTFGLAFSEADVSTTTITHLVCLLV